MFTLVGFTASQDSAAAWANIAAIQDQHVATSGNVITIPNLNNFVGAIALMGATVPGTPYLDSPSLRKVALMDISPVIPLTLPSPLDSADILPRSPVKLVTGEGLKCWENANPGAGEYHTVAVLLSDKELTPIKGEIFTVRATAAITAVAGSWVNGNLTLSQTLPVGKYSVVGASCQGTNAVLFRLVGSGYSWRPGFLCNQLITDINSYCQRNGVMGSWLEFDSITPPTLDLMAIAACTAQVVYLDLIKIS